MFPEMGKGSGSSLGVNNNFFIHIRRETLSRNQARQQTFRSFHGPASLSRFGDLTGLDRSARPLGMKRRFLSQVLALWLPQRLNLRKPVEQPLWGERYSELTFYCLSFFTDGKADGSQVRLPQRKSAERGLHADHVTVWRWVQRYAPKWNDVCARGSDRPLKVGG